jgi:hypothetical protein
MYGINKELTIKILTGTAFTFDAGTKTTTDFTSPGGNAEILASIWDVAVEHIGDDVLGMSALFFKL